MKGVILAAGKGTRMAELKLKHKSFAMVDKKHTIDYSLDLLSQSEFVSEIVVVVGHNASAIIDYLGDSYKNKPISYVYQNEQKGIAHAIKVAKDTINDDFILCLADEILLNPRLDEMINLFYSTNSSTTVGILIDGEDFSMKPIAYDLSGDEIVRVREKPDYYENDIRGVGECIFGKKTLSLLDELAPNSIRGEYEMGDWIQMIIDAFGNVNYFEIADAYVNINRKTDIDSAEMMINLKE